jgi:thiamine-phosphate pyrophosphorylase
VTPVSAVRFRLYLVTERSAGGTVPLATIVEQAIRGGVDAVQLREKDLTGRALFELATEVLAVCRRHGVPLLVNDRIDLALALGADGVHLPADSFPIEAARRLLGPTKLVGVSTHGVEEVVAAHCAGADFAVFGPVFETPSKARYGAPLGIEALRAAVRSSPLPLFAIGGVTAARAPLIRACGAHGVAVIRAILAGTDAASSARAIATSLAAVRC